MKVVVATEASTLILCWRASLLASPTVVPASTVPCRGMAPVRARIASSSVVLPLWKGPTNAMHRGPLELIAFELIAVELAVVGLLPFCPIFHPPLPAGSWTNVTRPVAYRLRHCRDWQGRIFGVTGVLPGRDNSVIGNLSP